MTYCLIHNTSQIVTCAGDGETAEERLAVIRAGAMVLDTSNGTLVWVGPETSLPDTLASAAVTTLDARQGVLFPGFVDAHTHLVFAGSRVEEFGMRCCGATYEEIAKAGGGIVVTTSAVRAASEEELVKASRTRLERMLSLGITTVEIKSGYGLTTEDELKMLRAIQSLRRTEPQTIVPTFLGAHVIAPEYKEDRESYVNLIVDEMLPAVAAEDLASYCDVFCEEGAFTVEEAKRILQRAIELGLGVRMHAEQLHRTGATALGVELGAASVDHLEFVGDEDIATLAKSDTVATLLPGATLFLGQERWPPARRLLDAGVKVALATDCNPGSCMTENLPLVATLGCVRLGMTPAEAILAITTHGAKSLGKDHELGVLKVGARADVVLANIPRYESLVYHYGVNHIVGVVVGGATHCWPPDEGSGGRQRESTSSP